MVNIFCSIWQNPEKVDFQFYSYSTKNNSFKYHQQTKDNPILDKKESL